ncbi:MAG: histidine--tRNA ligase [Elusimicrobiaceae bacterium]|nr:histidine--tRNA ligase [Elusimicrobiaceae bacterium]
MTESIRGFRDIFPPESSHFARLEAIARGVFACHAFGELRIPTVERHELFVKSTGETTDVVEKEMYAFEDAGGRRLALRPEGTPGVARACIQHNLFAVNPRQKLFYIGSMYRAERPQKGRYREFEQIGAEYIGNASPSADAETIIMLEQILRKAGLDKFSVELNSLGCAQCRPAYRAALLAYLHAHETDLCDNCRARIDKNPLRALDCKLDGPKLSETAPKQELCAACSEHFDGVLAYLRDAGIECAVNRGMVRGLDYYTRTVFEFKTAALGSQDAIAGGGRYDNLLQSMGGPDVPAVGWAMGVDRAVSIISELVRLEPGLAVYVISMGGPADRPAFKLLTGLRAAGLSADGGDFSRSFKSQLRAAGKSGAKFAAIIGENEVARGVCTLKNLETGEQRQVRQDEIAGILQTA